MNIIKRASHRKRWSLAAVAALVLSLLPISAAIASPTPNTGPSAGGTTVTVDASLSFTLVAACNGGGVAADSDGHMYQWGGGFGIRSGVPVQVPQGQIPAGATIKDLACGDKFAVAIASDGNAYAWGENDEGQLGDGTTTARTSPVLVAQGARPAGVSYTSISAGNVNRKAVAALGSDGRVYGWGANNSGQLGNGTTTDSLTPVVASAGAIPADVRIVDVTMLSSGSSVVALGSNGRAYAWGFNNFGTLGNGTNTSSSLPVAVTMPAGVTFTKVTGGQAASHAIGSDNRLYSWGWGTQGALGTGSDGNSNLPVPVAAGEIPVGTEFTAIGAGWQNGFAISTTGAMFTWGNNDYGSAGNGRQAPSDNYTPVAVVAGQMPTGVTITAGAAGVTQTLALGSDGRVYAMGSNSFGTLGIGHATEQNVTSPTLGLNFTATGVSFNGVAGTDFVGDGSSATVTTPPHASGSVDVVISADVLAGVTDTGNPHNVKFNDGFTYAAPPEITTRTLPDGIVSDPKSSPVKAIGSGPITFSVTDGEVPPGLALAPSTGVLGGTPTEAGTYTFDVTASNAFGSDTRGYTVAVRERPVITTTALPAGSIGQPYQQTVEATGTKPITFALSGGTLPPGTSLDPNTGIISGTPAQTGSFTFTITASNSVGQDQRAYTLVFGSQPTNPGGGGGGTGPDGAASDGSGTLPVTGSGGVLPWAIGGLAMLLLGLIAVGAGRYRNA